MLTIVRR